MSEIHWHLRLRPRQRARRPVAFIAPLRNSAAAGSCTSLSGRSSPEGQASAGKAIEARSSGMVRKTRRARCRDQRGMRCRARSQPSGLVHRVIGAAPTRRTSTSRAACCGWRAGGAHEQARWHPILTATGHGTLVEAAAATARGDAYPILTRTSKASALAGRMLPKLLAHRAHDVVLRATE